MQLRISKLDSQNSRTSVFVLLNELDQAKDQLSSGQKQQGDARDAEILVSARIMDGVLAGDGCIPVIAAQARGRKTAGAVRESREASTGEPGTEEEVAYQGGQEGG